MTTEKNSGSVLLLRTAGITLLIALVLAWCLTFTKALKVPFFVELIKSYDMLLSAHIDFLMMTMLLLGFYASRIALPKSVQWPMAIGSITNPGLFVVGAILGGFEYPVLMAIVFISFSLATYGYGMGAIHLIRASLK